MRHDTDYYADDQIQLFAILGEYPTARVRVDRKLANTLLKENTRITVQGSVRWLVIQHIGLDVYVVTLRMPDRHDQNIKNTIFEP